MADTPSGTPTPTWSCENKRGKCREPHGCHCREIEALRADGDRLREALRPFAKAADEADEAREESKRCGMGDLGESASTGLGIRFKHLYAARELYREMEGRS